MNVDTFARRMSSATREEVTRSLDLDARLRELQLTGARRLRARAVAALGAVSVAAALVVGVLPGRTTRDPPTAPDSAARREQPCPPHHPVVLCLDDSTVLVRGKTSYTFSVPQGFSSSMDLGFAPYSIEIFRTGVRQGGFTILEDVRAAGNQKVRGAESLSRWVRSRPFLQASPVGRGMLKGFQTWTVLVRPRGGEPGNADHACNGVQRACRPVLTQPSRSEWETGVWDRMLSRYTFLDVPGLGTVALWSWTFGGPSDFDHDGAVIRSIDFHVPS